MMNCQTKEVQIDNDPHLFSGNDDMKEFIKNFYENYNEENRLSSKHGSIEFLTTIKYINKYLLSNSKILEIGAGTGKYSHYFARQGYEVDAVELMKCNVEKFNELTHPGEKVTVTEGNAVDLNFIEDNKYDITLLLGPMYHLYDTDSKKSALSEAIRVTKTNGVIFVAYCLNEAQIIKACFMRGLLREDRYKNFINPTTYKLESNPENIFELYRKEDIDALIREFSVERLHYIGTDMATSYMKDCIDSMDEETFKKYLEYHFIICERADCIGVSHHSLDVLRKNECGILT